MTVEYAAIAVGAILLMVILFWKKLRVIDAQLRRMQNEFDQLQTIESRLFFMALNANPKVEASRYAHSVASSCDRSLPAPVRVGRARRLTSAVREPALAATNA
jgi:hypothetical protein